METPKRVKAGYVAGRVTREMASNLSFALWEQIRKEASPEMMELLNLHGSMEVIALGLDVDDSLADPLGNIIQVLEYLDGGDDEKEKAGG